MAQKKQTNSLAQHLKHGWSQKIAEQKLGELGNNSIQGKQPPTDFYFFIKQFKNPLVFVLLLAIGVTVLLQDYKDAIVIGIAVVINTALGFIQERKAFKSLESLKKVVTHTVLVIRDGEKKEVELIEVVPGDIVTLYEGDKVPADGIIFQESDALIDEAILTGESVPVHKNKYSISKKIQSVAELLSHTDLSLSKLKHEHALFMGTVVTSGSAQMVVTKTGMQTQLGSIAAHVEENRETKTPLEHKLDTLAKYITIVIVMLSFFIFLVGVLGNRDATEMFTTAVAIAVAAIPEGLVVGLTAILAVGMHRILKRKGLVRTLVAAETLGSVTTVCVDKTGTLTEGKMKVSALETDDESLLYKVSTIANDQKDPIEVARITWAQEYSEQHSKLRAPELLSEKYTRTNHLPFSVERRYLAVQSGTEIFVAGAPEDVLQKTTAQKKTTTELLKTVESWAGSGKRIIGFAYYKANSKESATALFKKLKAEKNVSKLKWVGLIGFDDPVRKSVTRAIKKTQQAGIAIKVITGDYRSTALSVMKQIGISVNSDEVIEGDELTNLSNQELREKVKTIKLFARTKPTQKLRIVAALKENGEVVGMMGDGVNDAPALSKADIGIVVASASEIAKESSELVLLDSNMGTITAAIEEGRALFDNLKKIILYLMSDSFSEIVLILLSLVSGMPIAIGAAQILWINVINDGLPNLALTIDPKSPDILKRKPQQKTQLLDLELLIITAVVSITSAVCSYLVFITHLPTHGLLYARTMVFAILSIDSLFYVYSCKNIEKNIWHTPIFNNRWLVAATVVGFVLTVATTTVPWLSELIGTTKISIFDWITVILVSLGVVSAVEVFKLIWNWNKD